jgi:ribonuclease E
VAHVDGVDVCVGEAAELVGKKVKVKIERVFEGVVYASLLTRARERATEPLTAEGEAEKPTRKPPARKAEERGTAAVADASEAAVDGEVEVIEEAGVPDAAVTEDEDAEAGAADDGAAPAKKKTRRGSRGGRNRKKKPAAATAGEDDSLEEGLTEEGPTEETAADEQPEPAKTVTIHLPPEDLGEDEADAPSENGDGPESAARKKTRRGSRGGKNRRKRTAAAAAAANGDEPAVEVEEAPEPFESEPAESEPAESEPVESESADEATDWGYVPMSQWGDEFEE